MKAHVPKHLLLAVFLFFSAAGFSQNIYISETFPDPSSSNNDDFGDDYTQTQDLGSWSIATNTSDSRMLFAASPGGGSTSAMRFDIINAGSDNATATSPTINLTTASGNTCINALNLKFNLYRQSVVNGDADITISLEFSSNGTSYTSVWSRTADQLYDAVNNSGAAVWIPYSVNIPAAYYTPDFKARFIVNRSGGNDDAIVWVDDIAIADPTIPDFSGSPTQIVNASGTGVQVGDVYKFENVITSPFPIYAEVKIEAASNASVSSLDNNATGVAQRFQPIIDPTSGNLTSDREGYVQFLITFKKTSDNSLVNLTGLRYRHFDVDGSATSSYTFRETGWVTGQTSLLVNNPSDLTLGGGAIADGGYTWAKVLGELDEHADITSDPDVYFTATYGSISAIRFRLGYIFDELTSASYDPAAREYGTEFGCFDIAQNIPLPVKFSAFDAKRTTSSNVAVTWTTAMEQNSKGFNVQRNVGGEWKTIAFVFSQAVNGSSSSDLSYGYKDINSEKGITQYRIQQVDLDGNAKYTDIRAVRGESAVSKVIVYPNPSVDGKINVVFDNNSGLKDVQVADMQGRVVKSYNGITSNVLVIERLTSGFYTIKITNRNTAASSVEKVVIK